MMKKIPLRLLLTPLLAACLWPFSGCREENPKLTLADLTGGEFVYVERMVILERAKAVALVDRAAGDAILDSLAVAWGDSSLAQTISGAPSDPVRSEAVGALLRRILAAEQDSLRAAPALDRLAAPLPDPPVPAPVPLTEESEDPED